MAKQSGAALRAVFLGLAVILIAGGATTLGRTHDHALTVIGAVVAVLVGLVFLQRAAGKPGA